MFLLQRRVLRHKYGTRSTNNKASVGETTIESSEVINTDGTKQTIFKRITNVRETWSNLSMRSKILIFGYVFGGSVNMFYNTYNNGKIALLEYRKNPSSIKFNGLTVTSEWAAVSFGCKRHSFENFLNSLIWPQTIFSNIMPTIVLALNPDPNFNKK